VQMSLTCHWLFIGLSGINYFDSGYLDVHRGGLLLSFLLSVKPAWRLALVFPAQRYSSAVWRPIRTALPITANTSVSTMSMTGISFRVFLCFIRPPPRSFGSFFIQFVTPSQVGESNIPAQVLIRVFQGTAWILRRRQRHA
jgi:hypothetical protein